MKRLFLCVTCAFLNILLIRADNIWTSFRPYSGYGNRNEFLIKEAISDENFVLGKYVYSWKSIKHGKHAYAVGLMSHGLTIIRAGVGLNKTRFNMNHTVFDLQQKPIDIALHGCWNKTTRKTELVLIVAVSSPSCDIIWYIIHDDLKMDKFWTLQIYRKIHQIEFYKQDRMHKLLIVSQDDANHTYADTYKFSLQEKSFWLTQTIELANPTKNSALSTSDANYLAIPQKTLNLILIFKYSDDHFVSYKNITCKNADFVVSFRVSFKSYLAVAGNDGAIFEFYKNTLRKIDVEGSALKGVKFWFPIPVNNFREEVVLLVQRRIETETHHAWHLEAVLHNENKFIFHEEFHCKFHGDEMTGLRCMADEDRENGIIGLTTLSVGQTLGLLVPRADNAPSGLLMLRTGMKSLSSKVSEEIKRIDETKIKIEYLLERHKQLAEKSKIVGSSWTSSQSGAFQEPFEESEWAIPEQQEIKELEMCVEKVKREIGEIQKQFNEHMEVQQENRFDTLIFNGIVKVEGSGNFMDIFAKNINSYDVDSLLKNAISPGSAKKFITTMEFENLEAQKLYFEHVNGISAEDLLFVDDHVNIKGDVVFKSPVTIKTEMLSNSGKVNKIILDKEVVITDRDNNDKLLFENLKLLNSAQISFLNEMPLRSNYMEKMSLASNLINLKTLNEDNLYIPVDIKVTNVNGENFDNLLNRIVMKNLPTKISQDVLIKGNLEVANISNLNYLNGNKFPDDFLVVNPSLRPTVVSGKKVFKNTLAVDEITTGYLNGIKLQNFFTLTYNQTIPATVHFENIEITENLLVDDENIEDEYLANFQVPPTLEESSVIDSDLSFQSLEIDGTLTVVQEFNRSNIEELLGSVVYKDYPIAEVNSVKEFLQGLSVVNNLDIKSNIVNYVPLNQFVLKDTDEVLQIKTLNGKSTFKNLYVTGLYDQINVTKLDEDTVKTFGQQYISADLKFDNLFIKELLINETLNDVRIENYLFTDGDRIFENDIEFDKVEAKNVDVEGNITIKLKNFDVKSFDERRMSMKRAQLIPNYNITKVHTVKLKVSQINGVPFKDLFSNTITAKQLTELAKHGNLKIKDMHIKGPLKIDNLNGVPTDSVLSEKDWKNKSHNQNGSLLLRGNARFGHVHVNVLDNVVFDSFIKELIFKNETNVRFSKFMVFDSGIKFVHNINTKKINGIALEHILPNINSPLALNIPGDLYINSNVAIENINEYPLQNVGRKLEIFDESLKLKDNVYFKNDLETEELWIRGTINEINATDIFEHAVFVDKSAALKKKIIFQQPVQVHSNFGVKETVDGINLLALMSSIVLKNKDSVVQSTVIFSKPVIVKNSFEVFGNMYAEYLDGCDIEKWKEDMLLINRGLLRGKFTFKDIVVNENLNTKFVNNQSMQHLIPLRTEQQISVPLQIGVMSCYHNITAENFINDRNLSFEFENTLLNGSKQRIQSNVEFMEEIFATAVEAHATVNGISLKNIVTTYTNQNLTGLYNFSKGIYINGNLEVNGNLNGIDVNYWYKNGLKKHSKLQQTMNGQLTLNGNLQFHENVEGSGRISGIEIATALEEFEKKRSAKYIIEKDVMNDYTKACVNVNHILQKSKKQIYSFKYFEFLQTMEFASPIQSILYFEHENRNYLFVNEKESCDSRLFIWNDNQFVFMKSVKTGSTAQIITVGINGLMFLVTRSTPRKKICTVNGTNIWLFQEQTLKRIKLLKMSTRLQDSRRPGTFYSIESEGVVEYRITSFGQKIRKYRIWSMPNNENTVFVPRGLGTGLALINNNEVVRLLQEELDDIKATISGGIVKNVSALPFNANNEMVVVNVGNPEKTRKLLVVATQEKSSIEKGLDFIKVYEDFTSKRLLQKIPSYKPSSLTSVEFENGETLLIFFEDEEILQIYEYKGIESFKRKISTRIRGNKSFVAYLGSGESKRIILGIIDKNKINLLDAVMMGNKLETGELNCEL